MFYLVIEYDGARNYAFENAMFDVLHCYPDIAEGVFGGGAAVRPPVHALA